MAHDDLSRHLQGVRRPRPLSRRDQRGRPRRAIGRALRRLPRARSASPCRATCGCRRRRSPRRSSRARATQGADVVDYGLCATDMMYFARRARRARRRRADHGVAQPEANTTASRWSGARRSRCRATPASATSATWSTTDAIPAPTRPPGRARARDRCSTTTSTKVMSFIDPAAIKPFNVVLDAGSGMAGLVAPRLFDRLPCRTTRLCFEIDGTFPNHEANPLIEENRRDIVERVIAETRRHRHRLGRRRRPLLLHRRQRRVHRRRLRHGAAGRGGAASSRRAQTIVYDVRASYAVKDIVARYGGTALMNRVGHAFIKRRMREENAVFGGEVTGHYYFRDFYYADNGFIPALLILELMSTQGQDAARAAGAAAREVLHLRRDQHAGDRHGRRSRRGWRRSPSATRTATPTRSTASRPSFPTGTSTCGLEHRAAAAPESRGAEPALMEQKRDEVLGVIRK